MTENAKPERELVTHESPSRATLRRRRDGADSASQAVVFRDRRHGLWLSDRPLTASEIYFSKPSDMYVVDTAVRSVKLTLSLPAKEMEFSFRADVQLSWTVADPLEAVRTGLEDAKSLYERHIEGEMRELSRKHGAKDSRGAEDAINHRYRGQRVDVGQGVVVTYCAVALSLDGSTHEHLIGSELAVREALNKQRLEELETAGQLADKQKRMTFYTEALENGNASLLALRLMGNHEEVTDVINLIMQQRQLNFDGARGVLNELLDGNLVNRKDVADIMARATSVLADHMSSNAFSSAPSLPHRTLEAVGAGTSASSGQSRPLTPASGPVDAELVDEDDDDD